MATYIKTLKEDNGDIVYPQTTTDAIYTTGGETLETRISKYVTAENIASSVASFGTVTTGMIADDAITTAKIDDDAVTTAKINDGAVTSQKIDWTTIEDITSDIGTNPSYSISLNQTSVYRFGKIVFVQMNFAVGNTAIPAGATVITGLPPAKGQVNVTGMAGNTSTRFYIMNNGTELFLGSSSTSLPAGSAAGFSFVYLTT